MQVYAFIDTNVLLHYRFFRDVDWAAVAGVRAVVLVFAPVVLAEMDDHKGSGSRREKARAKAVLKALDGLGLSTASVRLRAGVSVMAIADEPDEAIFQRHRLQQDVNDDRLLASLLAFREGRGGDDRVLLLSADAGLRVKARARQVELVTPDDSLASDEEPDETERQLAAAHRELAALRSAAPDLRVTIEGETYVEGEFRPVAGFDDVTINRLLEEWRSRHPHIRGMVDSLEMPGGGTLSFKSLRLPGLYSEEDAAEHNATIDRVFGEYEQYLRDWPSIVNRCTRSLKLTFVLENSGTAPADGVHVRLSTEAEGVWLEELPEVPLPPAMPRKRDPFDFGVDYHVPHFDAVALRHADRDMDGPTITEDEPQRVEFWVKRVTHHVPVELPAVHFQFSTDDAVKSFGIRYQLVAANIREPKTGALNVKLSVGDAVAPPPLPWTEAGE